MRYRLKDSEGNLLKWRFSSWSVAYNFKCLYGRPNWDVVELKTKTVRYG